MRNGPATTPSSRVAPASTRREWLNAGGRVVLQLSALWAGLPAAAQGEPAPTATPPAIGDTVRWPSLQLLDGRQLEPPAAGGRASVVVFFSTTCPFCARHNEHVQKLMVAARGLPLRVLGVAHDTRIEHVRTYLGRRGLGFDVSMDQLALHAALSRMKGIPLTCVVDRQQHLREVIRGEMSEEDVLGLLKWART
jgi:peroxiredoxin